MASTPTSPQHLSLSPAPQPLPSTPASPQHPSLSPTHEPLLQRRFILSLSQILMLLNSFQIIRDATQNFQSCFDSFPAFCFEVNTLSLSLYDRRTSTSLFIHSLHFHFHQYFFHACTPSPYPFTLQLTFLSS